VRVDAYPSLLLGAFKLDLAFHESKEGVIVPNSTVDAWVELRASLANDDRSGLDEFTGKALYAQSLGIRISTVLG